MLITKPYGRTSVESMEQPKRVLLRMPENADIPEFAASHDELVLAQWISAIDKIATKPKGNVQPTKEQRNLRTALGSAAWGVLQDRDKKLLTGEPKSLNKLKEIWDWKLHPYPEGDVKVGSAARGSWFERFCGERVKLTDVNHTAVAEMIRKHLYEAELRKKGKDKRPDDLTGGLIKARARSIESNVLQHKDTLTEGLKKKFLEYDVSEMKAAKYEYKNPGDVAQAIYKAIENKFKEEETAKKLTKEAEAAQQKGKQKPAAQHSRQSSGTNKCPKKDSLRFSEIAGKELFNHWKGIFPGKGIKEAFNDDPALFALHMAVKDCYARIFKKHYKDPQDLLKILPRDMKALFELVENKQQNQDLAYMVRLGKIIHYTASDPSKPDSPITEKSWNDAKDKIEGSRYWTTDGQTEIKRAEAFVRVWRRAIVFAARTLKDWADPENEIGEKINGDILLFKGWDKEKFNSEHYRKKLDILLGGNEEIFEYKSEDEQKRNLFHAIKWTAELRHNIFHFKGLGSFVDSLSYLDPQKQIDKTTQKIQSLREELKQAQGTANRNQIKNNISNQERNRTKQNDKLNEINLILEDIKKLWQEDRKKRRERMRETMIGADFHYFFNEYQNTKLLTAYLSPEAEQADVPLPRFSRMLERAHNIHFDNHLLPAPAKRDKLEEFPALRCEYTAQKLLYELPFKAWLEEKATITNINTWIKEAIDRTTAQAKRINKNKTEHPDLIIARAAHIRPLEQGEHIHHFFFRLSQATANEMRVQNAYESNGENAREQAEYIEELKCDVIARAFVAYLEAEKFTFTKRRQEEKKQDKPKCTIREIPDTRNDESKRWQHILYFLLHLIPVEEVAALRHQLNKWEALAGKHNYKGNSHNKDKEAAKQLLPVLRLYIDMHDAKFTGGSVQELHASKDLTLLFQSAEAFNRIFPKSQEADTKADSRVPIRGLREMMRFGHMKPLEHIFHAHKMKVTDNEVNDYKEKEKTISAGQNEKKVSADQKARERLHMELTRKGGFTEEKCNEYVHFLAQVSEHRLLAARVTLTDHVRIHRLAMNVLARLVDYMGLWERDLYFVTLAVMYENKKEFLFKEELEDGQVVGALRKRFAISGVQNAGVMNLESLIDRYFGKLFQKGDTAEIRNKIAHLAMLEYGKDNEGKIKPPLNLTDWINHARTLMAYDRKLKNAVTKSVIELLEREGLELKWKILDNGSEHILNEATVKTRQARHLGKKFVSIGKKEYGIYENLHGQSFVHMAAKLFGGKDCSRNHKDCYPKEKDVIWLAPKLPEGGNSTAASVAKK